MRSTTWSTLALVIVLFANPASASPAVADLDMEAPVDDVALAADRPVQVALAVQAHLECTAGFAAPAPVVGTMRGFVRDGPDMHEFAHAAFEAAWHDAGDGTFFVDKQLTLEIPDDQSVFMPGPNEVVVQFIPDQVREPTRRCQNDGYRIDPAQETFTVTRPGPDAETRNAALAVHDDNDFHLAPMALAVGLVALLALFAFRRQPRA